MPVATLNPTASSSWVRSNGRTFTEARDGHWLSLAPGVAGQAMAGGARTATDWCYRTFLFYDLSGIDASWINTAKLTLIPVSIQSTPANPNIYITEGHQLDPVTTADFDTVARGHVQRDELTIHGTVDMGTLSEGVRGDFPFDASGLALILAKCGSTLKLCIRGQNDIENVNYPAATAIALIFYHTLADSECKLVLDYVTVPPAAAPTVTTDPASALSAIAATLNGTLDDDGEEACHVRFQYGETSEYGIDTEWQIGKESVVAFEQTVSGLSPNTTYHFRAQAKNSAGTTSGADRTFTTLVATPTVTTDPASALSAIAATLNGTLDDDGGEACECGFVWGPDTGYGVTTPTQSKTKDETFSQVIRGLFPDTTYHFRAFATNSKGTGYGGDVTFTTKPVMSRAFALAREEL